MAVFRQPNMRTPRPSADETRVASFSRPNPLRRMEPLRLHAAVEGLAKLKKTRQVTGKSSALFLNCSSGMEEYLGLHQSAAASAMTLAYDNYSHDSPAAVKYFGAQHVSEHLLGVLVEARDIASSDEIVWSCDPAGAGDGTHCDHDGVIFYTTDNAQHSRDRTIHVCGERIMQLEGHWDDIDDASPTGAFVHEITHLAGTWCDGSYGDGPVLARAAANAVTTFYA